MDEFTMISVYLYKIVCVNLFNALLRTRHTIAKCTV